MAAYKPSTYSVSLDTRKAALSQITLEAAIDGLGCAVDRLESTETLLKIIYNQGLMICQEHPEYGTAALLHSTVTLAMNIVAEWKDESDELIGKWMAQAEREGAGNGK